jgi:hypothetical protein
MGEYPLQWPCTQILCSLPYFAILLSLWPASAPKLLCSGNMKCVVLSIFRSASFQRNAMLVTHCSQNALFPPPSSSIAAWGEAELADCNRGGDGDGCASPSAPEVVCIVRKLRNPRGLNSRLKLAQAPPQAVSVSFNGCAYSSESICLALRPLVLFPAGCACRLSLPHAQSPPNGSTCISCRTTRRWLRMYVRL